jgi:hypothetical protein
MCITLRKRMRKVVAQGQAGHCPRASWRDKKCKGKLRGYRTGSRFTKTIHTKIKQMGRDEAVLSVESAQRLSAMPCPTISSLSFCPSLALETLIVID